MKQNSRILFHHMRKQLTTSYLQLFSAIVATALLSTISASGADKPELQASFDPAKGFKPAQSDLTAVFLQIAGSLAFYGSPEPYLRHMKAEHARIEAKYQKQTGDKGRSYCPAYMDAAYFDRFAANWKHIAPQLGLESLAKTTGHLMQAAINGPDGKGTILVDVFNKHQHQVGTAMSTKKAVPIPEFDALKASMVKCMRMDETLADFENLTADQQRVTNPASDIRAAYLKLFSALDAGLTPADAEKIKTVILGIVTDVGHMAQSELEAGIIDEAVSDLISPPKAYSADSETALDATERSTLAGFLKKTRFTREDFPALDRFYSTIYDRLSTRGKVEMDHRVQAGMHPAK